MSVMENIIKWILTRWHHCDLLRLLVGTVVNGTKLQLIKTVHIYTIYYVGHKLSCH